MMLVVVQPWAQLVPPGCGVSPSAPSVSRDLLMHQKTKPKPTKETPLKPTAKKNPHQPKPLSKQTENHQIPPKPTNQTSLPTKHINSTTNPSKNPNKPPTIEQTRQYKPAKQLLVLGALLKIPQRRKEEVSPVFGKCQVWKLGPWVGPFCVWMRSVPGVCVSGMS